MNIKDIAYNYKEHKNFSEFINGLKSSENDFFSLGSLVGSSKSILIANSFKETNSNILVISDTKEDAAFLHNDLLSLFSDDKLLFFPSSYKRFVRDDQKDNSALLLRTDVLSKLANGHKNYIIITYPKAIYEKVITKKSLETNTLKLKQGKTLSVDFVVELLDEYGFERMDFVAEPGQFSVRGGIVDIFSFSNEFPFRVDFFGDEIDSIRTFDIETQLSKERLSSVSIIPDIKESDADEKKIPFSKFIKSNTLVFANDIDLCISSNKKLVQETLMHSTDIELDLNSIIISEEQTQELFSKFTCVEYGSKNYFKTDNTFLFNTVHQPSFNKNFDLLFEKIKELKSQLINVYIISENSKQIERLSAIFEDKNIDIPFILVETGLHEGYIDYDLNIAFFTDHQIFNRYHKYKLKTKFSKKGSITLSEISSLNKGDYVVHQDHGIGVFDGLQTIDINGKRQEVIKLLYHDSDILFVSIHSLHRISKYKSKDGDPPKIYKLGSGAWDKLKKKTKSKVKDIAEELIQLYAKRKEQKGFAFSEDTYMQNELEASFFFEDTPDQITATKAVKEDMENDIPMDRLVCGDVGFGKTEIAIRAAFKAVVDGKQVAVLVPTTILALQHYNTFKERMKDMPVEIDYISRLKSAKQQTETKKKLKDGKLDIIIGTHRIVGKDIEFKDLGLLIIDEEQKFGVSVKEKLRNFKLNVDTLTLTATPIPRTLQFSLMGARDLSIINTPPPNRYPIQTEVHTFSETVIKEAIDFEIERGGQVFLIHNRVQNIYEVEEMVNRICPNVRTIVAHGQMPGQKLEKIMLDFIDGDYGVLIATTIIESGLDIPNANTIIVNNAQNFGLSTLHQLRGRVGRTNKKAFAYFLAPPTNALSKDAARRLKAIEEFSELGAGFNLSLQDLDIRGAGNLLGGEQSGFIADIGFETYTKILNEAIQELKEKEYKELFTNNNSDKDFDNIEYVTDCQVDTDLELSLPIEYVTNISERIKLYRDLDNITNEEKLLEFEKNLKDRFGELPKQSKELLNIVRLRETAKSIGIEKVIIKNNTLLCYFIANQESSFFRSNIFGNIINKVQQYQKIVTMKEKNNKLMLTFNEVKSVAQANNLLSRFVLENQM